MSSDTGPTTRETTRTVIALLTVVGFVLIAAVLPIVGSEAPGRSLVPQNAAGEGLSGSQGSSLQRALRGQGTGSGSGLQGAGGSESMVKGLLSNLDDGASRQLDGGRKGSGQQGQGQRGESAFGALNPGSQTDVGSAEGLTSQSLRNQSATPHFIVESSEAGYWRTGAYDTYTGSGWDAEDLPVQAEWPRRPATAPEDRRTVTQTYRLLKPASALPGVWEPTDVQSEFADELQVTQQGAIKARSPMPANTTYTVESRAPPRNPERLRQAGRNYPERIDRTYTGLPSSTPERLTERTDEITAEADTPYEKAVAIESWLEANKEYSLNASHDGGDVADQFVFEMDAGYCEYFATSMTAMLRSQDVPARYTVGYSTGQPQGNGTYLVRAMNAHAWVEVYFPETGWVRFDPTPGQSRLEREFRSYQRAAENGNADEAAEQFLDQAEQGSLDGGGTSGSPGESSGGQSGDGETPDTSQPGGDGSPGEANGSDANASDVAETYNHTEEGSPGESFDPSSGPSYRISLQEDAIPGQPVTVLVERDGDPAEGVAVTFNGERVGRTNASGMVRGEVPFAARLRVDVRANATDGAAGSTGRLSPGGGATVPTTAGTDAVVAAGGAVQSGNETNATRSFDVPTDISIGVRGEADPGETVTVTTNISDRPVSDATVSVDGSAVGETDEDGELDVALPGRETVTLEASRGEAYGNRTLRLANVSVNTTGFALPGLSITVSVTDQGEPVEGATVTVGGKTVTTGADGTAEVSLPVATGATVQVETAGGITESQPVKYRFLTAGLALILALVTVAALVVLYRRAAAAGLSIREQLVATLYWLSGAFVAALVGLAVRSEALLSQFPAVARRVARALRGAWQSLVAAVRAQDFGAIPGPRALLAWVLAALGGLATSARSSVSTPSLREDDVETAAAVAEDPAGATPDARAQVRRAWREFRNRLPVADHRTKTPGELARIGIDEGFPSGAVGTLRDAVQAIEYGRRDPHGYLDDVAAAERELDGSDGRAEDGEAGATDGPRSAPHATDGGESE
jgi:transglutaminase-like putative cysteine protease